MTVKFNLSGNEVSILETITGDPGGVETDDFLIDTTGDDIINGLQGNDFITADQGGKDTIDGGSGDFDGVSYEALATATVIKANLAKGKVKVKQKNDGNKAKDRLDNVEQLYGHSGKDKFKGDDKNNFLRGFAGDDKLNGKDGDDSLKGDGGADKLKGGDGNDRLKGGDGDDKLIGGKGQDTIHLEAGNDLAKAGKKDGESDTFLLNPGFGDDIVKQFEASHDKIDLTFVKGSLILENGASVASLQDLIDGGFIEQVGRKKVLLTIDGNSLLLKKVKLDKLSNDNFIFPIPTVDHFGKVGTDANDTFEGGDANDFNVFGLDGDDTLDGKGGDDIMDGGLGHDILKGGEGRDTLSGGAGDDILLEGEGDFDDRLAGGKTGFSDDADRDEDVFVMDFSAATGRDFINDFSVFEDILLVRANLDDLSFSDSNGVLVKNGEDNVGTITGSSVTAIEQHIGLSILEGDPTFIGTGAADTQTGSLGQVNVMLGAAGDDIMVGADLDDILIGGGDNDDLSGGGGQDHLFGSSGNDTLFGGLGDDVIKGGDGEDTINGGEGDDLLLGFTSTKVLIEKGDLDKDTFVFGENFGNDTIINFEDIIDKLDLTALGIDTLIEFNARVTAEDTIVDGIGNVLIFKVLSEDFATVIGTISIQGQVFDNVNSEDFILTA